MVSTPRRDTHEITKKKKNKLHKDFIEILKVKTGNLIWQAFTFFILNRIHSLRDVFFFSLFLFASLSGHFILFRLPFGIYPFAVWPVTRERERAKEKNVFGRIVYMLFFNFMECISRAFVYWDEMPNSFVCKLFFVSRWLSTEWLCKTIMFFFSLLLLVAELKKKKSHQKDTDADIGKRGNDRKKN